MTHPLGPPGYLKGLAAGPGRSPLSKTRTNLSVENSLWYYVAHQSGPPARSDRRAWSSAFHFSIEFYKVQVGKIQQNVLMVFSKVANILKNLEIKGAASDFGRAEQSGCV
jgi:hypothetical protein